MAISALVITLEPTLAEVTRRALARDARLTLGAPVRHRLPVVAETPSCAAGEALVAELQQRRGVRFVDVVMVDFSDDTDHFAAEGT